MVIRIAVCIHGDDEANRHKGSAGQSSLGDKMSEKEVQLTVSITLST